MVVGIDESPQMGRLARRNLRRFLRSTREGITQNADHDAYTHFSLTRGIAQFLPFPNEAFDTVVATFPTEYITDPLTLAEVQRCLRKNGRLITLPVALPRNPLLDRLFKATHQRPTEALEVIQTRLKEPFVAAGFITEVETLDVRSGILLIVKARV
jgi:ubiquinone/menaquinone biosynthesis C-methylase UbiE